MSQIGNMRVTRCAYTRDHVQKKAPQHIKPHPTAQHRAKTNSINTVPSVMRINYIDSTPLPSHRFPYSPENKSIPTSVASLPIHTLPYHISPFHFRSSIFHHEPIPCPSRSRHCFQQPRGFQSFPTVELRLRERSCQPNVAAGPYPR